jgi:hypothetical protein
MSGEHFYKGSSISPRELLYFSTIGEVNAATVGEGALIIGGKLYWCDGTNLIAQDDFIHLASPVWDDLRFPATGINPPGAAADPGRSTTTGLLEFSGSADNIICGVAQMPHSWKEGSALGPHLHLRFPTSATANTRWKLEYDVASPAGNFTNNSGTWSDGGTITVANPENVKKHVLADFTDIVMTGKTFSTIVLWRITRLASTDAADNDTSAVELLEFDIHFEIDSMGSVEEYSKWGA